MQTRLGATIGRLAGKAPSDRPTLKPYWGKPAVRKRLQEKASVLSGKQTHQGNSQLRAHPDFAALRLIRDGFAVHVPTSLGDPQLILSFP